MEVLKDLDKIFRNHRIPKKELTFSQSEYYNFTGNMIKFDCNNNNHLKQILVDLEPILRNNSVSLAFNVVNYINSCVFNNQIFERISKDFLEEQNFVSCGDFLYCNEQIPLKAVLYKKEWYQLEEQTARDFNLIITGFKIPKLYYITSIICYGWHPNCDRNGFFCPKFKELGLTFPNDIRKLKNLLECANIDDCYDQDMNTLLIKKIKSQKEAK